MQEGPQDPGNLPAIEPSTRWRNMASGQVWKVRRVAGNLVELNRGQATHTTTIKGLRENFRRTR